jgi:prepilin-type N-terminal cleavage/methylation domain-containing protein
MSAVSNASGFTLVEVLVATALLCSAVAGLAHLGVLAAAQSAAVQRDGLALALAQDKLEELRALSWSFDAAGARQSDPALGVSPPDALSTDTAGFVDFLDRFGASTTSAAAAYHRRWAVAPVDPVEADTLSLSVCVFTRAAALHGAQTGVCAMSVRTRRLQ